MSFPVADKYPALFPSRKRAFTLVRRFESLLYEIIQNRTRTGSKKKHDARNNQVVHMLEEALKEGKITEKQYRDNLKITFIVGHENTQLLLNSMFYQIGSNQVSNLNAHLSVNRQLTCITLRRFRTNCAMR